MQEVFFENWHIQCWTKEVLWRAAYAENFRVEHTLIDSEKNLEKLAGVKCDIIWEKNMILSILSQ